MSPCRVSLNEKEIATLGSGLSRIILPEPPGGFVAWSGDKDGWVLIRTETSGSARFPLPIVGSSASLEFNEGAIGTIRGLNVIVGSHHKITVERT